MYRRILDALRLLEAPDPHLPRAVPAPDASFVKLPRVARELGTPTRDLHLHVQMGVYAGSLELRMDRDGTPLVRLTAQGRQDLHSMHPHIHDTPHVAV